MSEPGSQNQPDEALIDLLIKQATEGLSPAEQRALDVLDSAVASAHLRDFERAAAAIALAGSTNAEPLPAVLAQSVARRADEHLPPPAAPGPSEKIVDLGAARSAADVRTPPAAATRETPPAAPKSAAYGWLAAAACLVLAVFAWNCAPPPAAPVAVVTPPAEVIPPIPTPVAPPTAAEERAALLAKSESLKVTVGATKDPAAAGVSGDVVWDPATQRGFLHLVGLAPNDPALRQYQMWIFDAGRDKRYPVDGGVFDVPANATEVIIPIHAALMVRKPAAFAVTLEKPGGAVVSGREHVIVLGAAT